MSNQQSTAAGEEEPQNEPTPSTAERSQARLDVLEEENRRLRRLVSESRRASYRRVALGLATIGILAIGGALAFPDARTVLFALAGTGLFAAVLTYYISPERFIAADTGERVYRGFAASTDALTAQLELTDTTIYLPAADRWRVRLFIPQSAAFDLPAPAALDEPLITSPDSQRGLAVIPTGATLFEPFEQALDGTVADTPSELLPDLAEALEQQFELVETTDVEYAVADGRVSVAVDTAVWTPIDRFDHPVVSFLAVGLVIGLETPVETTVIGRGETAADNTVTVTLEWNPETV